MAREKNSTKKLRKRLKMSNKINEALFEHKSKCPGTTFNHRNDETSEYFECLTCGEVVVRFD